MARIDYPASGSLRGPTPAIWSQFEKYSGRKDQCVEFYDDFETCWPAGTQTTEIAWGRYKVFATTAGVWASTALVPPLAGGTAAETAGGFIAITPDTDNDSGAVATQACPFLLNPSNGKFAFEARVAVSSIATASLEFFVGMCENDSTTAFATGKPLTGGGVTDANYAMVGFNRLEGGLGVLNTVTVDRAAAFTNTQASAGAIVANTFIKLGMVYDPASSVAAMRFYVNGVATTTPISAATWAAKTHLDAQGMGPCIAVASGGATTHILYLDWWRAMQLNSVL